MDSCPEVVLFGELEWSLSGLPAPAAITMRYDRVQFRNSLGIGIRFSLCATLAAFLLSTFASAARAKPTRASLHLKRLAETRFGRLIGCEAKLLNRIAAGEPVYCGRSHETAPQNCTAHLEGSDIRAAVIRWLSRDPEAAQLVDPMGIQVDGGRVVDQLNLSFVHVPFALSLRNSLFCKNINLAHSQLVNFDVAGSHGRAIDAEGVVVHGNLGLNRFTSDGGVDLTDAELGGGLLCSGATIKHPAPSDALSVGALGLTDALRADGLKVTGDVNLNDGFVAEGEVRLLGANVGGNLEGGHGIFTNPGGDALSVNGAKVIGDMNLGNGFQAKGTVRLPGATVGGDLNFDGGTFEHPLDYAINARSGIVNGMVLLRNGFSSSGRVVFIDAHIGGDFIGDLGKFKNSAGPALEADYFTVDHSVRLRQVRASGAISLLGADIGGDLNCDGGIFENPDGYALKADAITVNEFVFLRSGFSARGIVSFRSADVKRELQVTGQYQLDLSHARVGPFTDAEEKPRQKPALDLEGFVYSRFAGGLIDVDQRLKWLKRQGSDFRPQPYEQLASVLRANGDDRGARRVLTAMENDRWRNGKEGNFERLWMLVLWVAVGYGYALWHALLIIGGFVILGWVLFSRGYRRGLIIPTHAADELLYQPFNAFIYSLETFLPIVDLYQSKHWLPEAGRSTSARYLRIYLWIHTLMGWFFTAMLIAGVTGLVQRA
jgi:hypothetical protein